eukprot:762637-Hanusia_phi.AAC.4
MLKCFQRVGQAPLTNFTLVARYAGLADHVCTHVSALPHTRKAFFAGLMRKFRFFLLKLFCKDMALLVTELTGLELAQVTSRSLAASQSEVVSLSSYSTCANSVNGQSCFKVGEVVVGNVSLEAHRHA